VPTAQHDQVYETLHTQGTGDFILEAFGTHVSEERKEKRKNIMLPWALRVPFKNHSRYQGA